MRNNLKVRSLWVMVTSRCLFNVWLAKKIYQRCSSWGWFWAWERIYQINTFEHLNLSESSRVSSIYLSWSKGMEYILNDKTYTFLGSALPPYTTLLYFRCKMCRLQKTVHCLIPPCDESFLFNLLFDNITYISVFNTRRDFTDPTQ